MAIVAAHLILKWQHLEDLDVAITFLFGEQQEWRGICR